MWPDLVSNPDPLALESDALPTALRGPALVKKVHYTKKIYTCQQPTINPHPQLLIH